MIPVFYSSAYEVGLGDVSSNLMVEVVRVGVYATDSFLTRQVRHAMHRVVRQSGNVVELLQFVACVQGASGTPPCASLYATRRAIVWQWLHCVYRFDAIAAHFLFLCLMKVQTMPVRIFELLNPIRHLCLVCFSS